MWNIYLLTDSVHSKTVINLKLRDILFSPVFQSRAFHDLFGDKQENITYSFCKVQTEQSEYTGTMYPLPFRCRQGAVISFLRGQSLTKSHLIAPPSCSHYWRRKWQPTPVFLPGESQGWWSLVGCCLWGRTESDMTEAT